MHKTKITQHAITVSAALLLVGYVVLNKSDFSVLFDVRPLPLVIGILLYALSFVTNALLMQIVLKHFNRVISLIESLRVTLMSSVGNFFAPAGAGIGLRALYLKMIHKLPYSDYFTILGGSYLVVLLINGFIGLFSSLIVSIRNNNLAEGLVLFFSLILVGSCFIILSRKQVQSILGSSPVSRLPKKLQSVLSSVAEGWEKLSGDPFLVAKMGAITLANLIITVMINRLIILSLGLNIEIFSLILFSVVGTLTIFINITPANFGVKEALYLAIASIIGFSAPLVLSIALLDRAIMLIVMVIGWIFTSINKQEWGEM
jgi:uncharacterized protein (TIRG00374 family)